MVPLIGLILNYTPWGIELYPVLASISLFIVVTSAVGWYRQQRLPSTDPFQRYFQTLAYLTGYLSRTKQTLQATYTPGHNDSSQKFHQFHARF